MSSPRRDSYLQEDYLHTSYLHHEEDTGGYNFLDGIGFAEDMHCGEASQPSQRPQRAPPSQRPQRAPPSQRSQPSHPSQQMSLDLNDVDDAKMWAGNVEKLFIQLMVDQMVKGNMPEGVFPKRIWDDILFELNKLTRRNFKLVQLKTKFNRLRQRHRIFSQLLQHTGLGWNADTNTVEATDEVWKNVIAAIPKAKEFRRKGCENYMLLGALFNKTTATGVMAFASTQRPTTTDEERELDERFISTGVHIDVDVDVEKEGTFENLVDEVNPVGTKTHSPSKRPQSGSSIKRRKFVRKGDKFSEMTDALHHFARIQERNIEERTARYATKYAAAAGQSSASSNPKPTTPPIDEKYSLQSAIALLNTYQGRLAKEKFYKVLKALFKHGNRVVFLELQEEFRMMWMECLEEEQ